MTGMILGKAQRISSNTAQIHVKERILNDKTKVLIIQFQLLTLIQTSDLKRFLLERGEKTETDRDRERQIKRQRDRHRERKRQRDWPKLSPEGIKQDDVAMIP